MKKLCYRCQTEKDRSEFYLNRSRKDGLSGSCKSCQRLYVREHYQQNTQYYKDKANANRKKSYERHGISEKRFCEMLASQDGVCVICKKSPAVVVDHDHTCCPGSYSCGRCVRGILCSKCNLGIGHFGDDPDTLHNALTYIRNRAPVSALASNQLKR